MSFKGKLGTAYYKLISPNYFKVFKYNKKISSYSNISIPIFDLNLDKFSKSTLKNKVCIWGQEINLTNNIEWNKDYFSGYIWPNKFYKSIIKVPNNGADVKFPWELSRFHQALWLAYTYKKSKNAEYALKFKNLVLDWENKNKFANTVNWTCTMDVAIRASNLVYSFLLFKQLGYNFEPKFESFFLSLMYKHGIYIKNNLEYGSIRGNHYTSDIVGLFILGLFFNNYSFGKLWLKFSLKKLEKEIKTQTLDSGVNFELSIPYHRLTTELFLYSYIFGTLNNIKFSNNYFKILKKQLEFIANYTKPNGFAPLISDNDSGHLFYFPCFDNRNHTFLLKLGNEFLMHNFLSKDGFTIYKDAGFVIYRNKKIYLFFKNSLLGLSKIGGHNHNDNLSFELNYNKKDIFVDQGVYVYTPNPKMRNLYRSTKNHNTVYLGEEQNSFAKGLFALDSKSTPIVLKINIKSKEIIGKLKYFDSYHKRIITISDSCIQITDFVKDKGTFNLIFNPHLNIIKKNLIKNTVQIKNDNIYINKTINIINANYSKDYYYIENTKKITYNFKHKNNFFIKLG